MNEDTITLSVAAFGKTVTITQPDEMDIHEFLNTCKSLAMAIEYHPESWDRAILSAADEIVDEDDQRMIDEYYEQESTKTKYPNAIIANGEEYVIIDGIKYTKPQEC